MSVHIAIINPPHTAIGSRIPREQLPPLGLLCVAGPLIDAGYIVNLVDAEFGPLPLVNIVSQVQDFAPEFVIIGHSGSSSVHATVMQLSHDLKIALPQIKIVYGGVHPSYHWESILNECNDIDYIVRGEGEQSVLNAINAISQGQELSSIQGLAYRVHGKAHSNTQASVITDLNKYRVAWELIDHKRYSYWGGKRAVVAQFSRGCPYLCSYCGQRGFWTTYRHRDPVLFAKELARLYREEGVELINFADELPTGSKKAWKQFLEALIAENVPLILVGSTRTGDIVRDAEFLHLYKKAGMIRFLLGIESYSESTLKNIKKGSSLTEDQQAIKLLRQHGIISMATYVVGFEEETDADYWLSFKHLLKYDPDQIQMLYVTPHRWTPYYPEVANRQVIELDSRKWDYKHQVLANKKMPAWRVFIWVKAIELMMQTRPKAIARTIFRRDKAFSYAMRWYARMGRRVWFHEVFEFVFRRKHIKDGPTVAAYFGQFTDEGENSMRKVHKTSNNSLHSNVIKIVPANTVQSNYP